MVKEKMVSVLNLKKKKIYTARRFDRAGTNMDQQHLSENTII
jgi:hypothetical protein